MQRSGFSLPSLQASVAFGLPLLVYLAAWTGLTALGAVIFEFDQTELWTFLGVTALPVAHRAIGTWSYNLFLVLPYVVVPLGMFAGGVAASHLLKRFNVSKRLSVPSSTLALYVFMLLCAAYCVYQLIITGNVVPDLLFTNAPYDLKIVKRAEIIDELNFRFYAVLYSFIPMISCIFFIKFISNAHFVDLIGLLIASVLFFYLTCAVYMKAPFVIFLALLTLTVILTKANWRYIVVLGVLAIFIYVAMQAVIGGLGGDKSYDVDVQGRPQVEQQVNGPVTERQANLTSRFGQALIRAPANVAYRMSSAYPFYIGIFNDPAARCGVESNNIPLLAKPICNLPTKVFRQMYPSVTKVQGFAPAAAHVSALGEMGAWYAVLVLFLSGLSLGVLAAISAAGRGALFIGLNVATCAYAYYLTQVPFLGAVTYAHGLVFFLMPLLFVAAWGAVFRWLKPVPQQA